jgi:hypothetical protein
VYVVQSGNAGIVISFKLYAPLHIEAIVVTLFKDVGNVISNNELQEANVEAKVVKPVISDGKITSDKFVQPLKAFDKSVTFGAEVGITIFLTPVLALNKLAIVVTFGIDAGNLTYSKKLNVG